ncbi:aminotransferase class V-fold PLP-dependent enzyme [Kitasatospora purpeofusca]|uniref:aminotransferase class V-fold PLP-dependent enzyme n=1 Tax=Kitasatospora purpeofusca TaxID=67352 RepID=UPI0022547DE9|nr:aminotransferase class V-fold PLP-dependent enzyme [Kitasatospora purpeofusca]MCX4684395.1 aminotransferase class V-fold PLP-dependent enzyme [Kitasatospora purpeofusca]
MPEYLKKFAEPFGYLDFARFGPVSEPVRRVLLREADRLHRHGWDALESLDADTAAAARTAGGLLGCAPHEIAFVGSTSHGLFAAAHAVGAGAGAAGAGADGGAGAVGGLAPEGTVLVARNDFPGAVYPWLRAADNGGLAVRQLEGPVTADLVRGHLDDRVRAVAVCAVDAATGYRAPLAAIKELIGPDRILVVDAVQALGAVEFAADAADVLAAGGQKWLRAGWGAAVLMVRDRIADRIGPGLSGWSGVVDPIDAPAHPCPPRPGAVAHTLTNPDGPAVAALGAALALVREEGAGRIEARIGEVLGGLLAAARAAGAETGGGPTSEAPYGSWRGAGDPVALGSGIARLRLPGADPVAVHRALTDAGLATTLRAGWIRLSPHASTDPGTAELLGGTLAHVRRGARTA